MALLADLAEVEVEISAVRLRLTDAVLRVERDKLREELLALQNRAMRLMHDYIDLLGTQGGIGDWEIRVIHRSADLRRPDQTAVARRIVEGQAVARDAHLFWFMLHYELGRAVRGILELEGEPVPRDEHSDAMSLMQDDMHELLRLLALGDYARPISPHEVMQQEILPRVRIVVGIIQKLGRAMRAAEPPL
jgi:hypothetical protein